MVFENKSSENFVISQRVMWFFSSGSVALLLELLWNRRRTLCVCVCVCQIPKHTVKVFIAHIQNSVFRNLKGSAPTYKYFCVTFRETVRVPNVSWATVHHSEYPLALCSALAGRYYFVEHLVGITQYFHRPTVE